MKKILKEEKKIFSIVAINEKNIGGKNDDVAPFLLLLFQ